jgi:hypothetical protein
MECAIVASSIALEGIEFEDRGGGCRERDPWVAARAKRQAGGAAQRQRGE